MERQEQLKIYQDLIDNKIESLGIHRNWVFETKDPNGFEYNVNLSEPLKLDIHGEIHDPYLFINTFCVNDEYSCELILSAGDHRKNQEFIGGFEGLSGKKITRLFWSPRGPDVDKCTIEDYIEYFFLSVEKFIEFLKMDISHMDAHRSIDKVFLRKNKIKNALKREED